MTNFTHEQTGTTHYTGIDAPLDGAKYQALVQLGRRYLETAELLFSGIVFDEKITAGIPTANRNFLTEPEQVWNVHFTASHSTQWGKMARLALMVEIGERNGVLSVERHYPLTETPTEGRQIVQSATWGDTTTDALPTATSGQSRFLQI